MFNKIVEESKRCLSCKNPTCKSACPIGNDIPRFLSLAKEGKYVEAIKVIGHPFGEICGYVCPRELHCQGGCVLFKNGKEVLISEIEKALFCGYPYMITRQGNILNNYKIAVIGGGVSGITFACKTYEQGANVTVFERNELLSTLELIPSFRLPREALARVKDNIVKTFNVIKKDVTYCDLKKYEKQFDVVYIASGVSRDYSLDIDGQELSVGYKKFLENKYNCGDVVVIGGGNSAVDCARQAVHYGNKAIVAYRRTEQDMPAFDKEIAAAKEEGVEFVYNVAPIKLSKSYTRLNLTLARTVSEGRGKLSVTDQTYDLNCDCVVSAVGSKFDSSILGVNQKNNSSYLQYSNVYLGGDALNGKLVADAVSDGIKAAKIVVENARDKCL